jgi:hypothetical protein
MIKEAKEKMKISKLIEAIMGYQPKRWSWWKNEDYETETLSYEVHPSDIEDAVKITIWTQEGVIGEIDVDIESHVDNYLKWSIYALQKLKQQQHQKENNNEEVDG